MTTLQEGEREAFMATLGPKITSCMLLDGTNGITERDLIDRLKSNWGLNIDTVCERLGIRSVADLPSIYGNKFYVSDGRLYVGSGHMNKGVRRSMDLIYSTNVSNAKGRAESLRRSNSRRSRGFQPFSSGGSMYRPSRSMYRPAQSFPRVFAHSSYQISNIGPATVRIPAVPVPDVSVAKHEYSHQLGTSSVSMFKKSMKPYRPTPLISVKMPARPIEITAKMPTSPIEISAKMPTHPPEITTEMPTQPIKTKFKSSSIRPNVSEGFKLYALAHISNAKSTVGLLGHNPSSSSVNTESSQDRPTIDYAEVERAYLRQLEREKNAGKIRFEDEDDSSVSSM